MPEATTRLDRRHTTVLVLAVIAAAIHFFRASVDPDIRILFTLNGVGFLALAAGAVFIAADGVRRWSRRVLIAYSAVTVALYLYWGAADGTWVVPWGPLATLAEVALIAVLFAIGRDAAQRGEAER